MNLFLVLASPDGQWELVTPPLGETILPGVTRDSVLSLARQHADPSATLKISGIPENVLWKCLGRERRPSSVLSRKLGIMEIRYRCQWEKMDSETLRGPCSGKLPAFKTKLLRVHGVFQSYRGRQQGSILSTIAAVQVAVRQHSTAY